MIMLKPINEDYERIVIQEIVAVLLPVCEVDSKGKRHKGTSEFELENQLFEFMIAMAKAISSSWQEI